MTNNRTEDAKSKDMEGRAACEDFSKEFGNHTRLWCCNVEMFLKLQADNRLCTHVRRSSGATLKQSPAEVITSCPLTVADPAGCLVGNGARLAILHDIGNATLRATAGVGAAQTTALPALHQTTCLSVGGLHTGDAIGAGAHGAWWWSVGREETLDSKLDLIENEATHSTRTTFTNHGNTHR